MPPVLNVRAPFPQHCHSSYQNESILFNPASTGQEMLLATPAEAPIPVSISTETNTIPSWTLSTLEPLDKRYILRLTPGQCRGTNPSTLWPSKSLAICRTLRDLGQMTQQLAPKAREKSLVCLSYRWVPFNPHMNNPNPLLFQVLWKWHVDLSC